MAAGGSGRHIGVWVGVHAHCVLSFGMRSRLKAAQLNKAANPTVPLVDPDRECLWPAAGPLVSRNWLVAIGRVAVGPIEGCCAAAAFFKARVIVDDISTQPNLAR